MRPTGVKRSLLLVPVLFAALLVLPTAPAWACSCVVSTTAQSVGAADVVLRGTLEDVDEPAGLPVLQSSGDTMTYRFAVAEVFKGQAAATTYVHSAASGASCGIEGLVPGREYVVFATMQGEALWSGLCGGTAMADVALVAEVETVSGAGHAPVPSGHVDSAGSPAGAGSGHGVTAWLVPLVGGGLLALVLAGLLVGVVLHGRRRV